MTVGPERSAFVVLKARSTHCFIVYTYQPGFDTNLGLGQWHEMNNFSLLEEDFKRLIGSFGKQRFWT
jgi:hypothetical protein